MGRKSLESSVLHEIYLAAFFEGLDDRSADELAKAAVDTALEQRKARRRQTKRDSARRRRQILGVGYSDPGEVPPKKTPITIWLGESDAAILNAEAQRMADDPILRKDRPLEFWRSAVVVRLLGSLASDNRRQESRREQTIAALQSIIASERKRGVLDADIQREVDKSHLGMSIDDILAYQFKTVRTSQAKASSESPF